MDLENSGRKISYISRIAFQIPTIALSSVTMIAISRSIGPSGRGELTQFLLLAIIMSSVLSTPIFLTIMNLKNAIEIKSYLFTSLHIFNRKNLGALIFINFTYYFLAKSNNPMSDLLNIILLDLLVIFYFVATQIRDFLLRFHKNEVYGFDFILQTLISLTILWLWLQRDLSAANVIQIFVFFYGLFALTLIVFLRIKLQTFNFANFIFKSDPLPEQPKLREEKESFSKLGILFHLSLSKDLLIGTVMLSSVNFGLMSALASFWVVVRFLRPSSVIQLKLSEDKPHSFTTTTKGILAFATRSKSAIHVQAIIIGLTGMLGYLLTPILMGRGFKPSIVMTISGITAEILLMRCLYNLSTSPSRYRQNLFISLFLFQIIFLGVLFFFGVNPSITTIWFSSCLIYTIYEIINFARAKLEYK
jgi:hypothetical protein